MTKSTLKVYGENSRKGTDRLNEAVKATGSAVAGGADGYQLFQQPAQPPLGCLGPRQELPPGLSEWSWEP